MLCNIKISINWKINSAEMSTKYGFSSKFTQTVNRTVFRISLSTKIKIRYNIILYDEYIRYTFYSNCLTVHKILTCSDVLGMTLGMIMLCTFY